MNNYEDLAQKLKVHLEDNRQELISSSLNITGNSLKETEVDLNRSIDFLNTFFIKNLPNNLKPKGDILIILSFNEPLLISVIPIFCALATGNKVYVRPSSKCSSLFKSIWRDFTDKNLVILDINVNNFEDYIRQMKSVYFFGSFENAKKIYALCAKYFVEFIPEVETADVKILNYQNFSSEEIMKDINLTMKSSFDRDGKTCQRISGIFIKNDIYTNYISHLDQLLTNSGFKEISLKELDSKSAIENDIFNSKPSKIYMNKDEYVVIDPNPDSDYVKNGYFNKSLWVRSFSSTEDLIQLLNNRIFFLGLNIISDNKLFIDQIILNTNFSRYTLNNNHCDISKDFGWGGNWPSGTGGYKTWFETFTNKFTVIK